MKIIAAFALGMLGTVNAYPVQNDPDPDGFVHTASTEYTPPDDPAVLQALDQWQDLKFGIFFHWGLYSVEGISESWPLCSEEKFTPRRQNILPGCDYEGFKRWYWGQAEKFNPVNFNPQAWAAMMRDAGTKYMVFTTKHHDGFCMFDTEFSDFKVTAGPFAHDANANITKALFDAFRNEGFKIGAYFSKADWHDQYYWSRQLATPTRGVNYDIDKHPGWWAQFKKNTAGQIKELMSDYGRVDILWLDGGWVRAPKEDINIDSIVDMARSLQPGLIAVDRTVHGRNENYTTPEMRVPDRQLPYPWETNTTITNRWGWTPRPKYKSERQLVNLLAEVVAKGGNLLLDVGPRPDGTIEEQARTRLAYIGRWLDKNGESIYNTRPTEVYNSGNIWFTASKDGKTIYAIYALPDGENLPAKISWHGNIPSGKITLLSTGRKISHTTDADGLTTVRLPDNLPQEAIALKFRIK
ncbi:MAG: alpha-L-fucosidase [Muribaculaceae bacterium]|nr:alpha-L-fucosidase [Muribaculaceae bacterium]